MGWRDPCARCCAQSSGTSRAQGSGTSRAQGFHCRESPWLHPGINTAWHWANNFVLLWRSGGTWTGYFAGIALDTEALALLGQQPFVPLALPSWMWRNGLARVTLTVPRPWCWSKDDVGTESVLAWRWSTSRSCSCFILSFASEFIHGMWGHPCVFTWWQLIQLSYKCLVLFSLNRAQEFKGISSCSWKQ